MSGKRNRNDRDDAGPPRKRRKTPRDPDPSVRPSDDEDIVPIFDPLTHPSARVPLTMKQATFAFDNDLFYTGHNARTWEFKKDQSDQRSGGKKRKGGVRSKSFRLSKDSHENYCKVTLGGPEVTLTAPFGIRQSSNRGTGDGGDGGSKKPAYYLSLRCDTPDMRDFGAAVDKAAMTVHVRDAELVKKGKLPRKDWLGMGLGNDKAAKIVGDGSGPVPSAEQTRDRIDTEVKKFMRPGHRMSNGVVVEKDAWDPLVTFKMKPPWVDYPTEVYHVNEEGEWEDWNVRSRGALGINTRKFTNLVDWSTSHRVGLKVEEMLVGTSPGMIASNMGLSVKLPVYRLAFRFPTDEEQAESNANSQNLGAGVVVSKRDTFMDRISTSVAQSDAPPGASAETDMQGFPIPASGSGYADYGDPAPYQVTGAVHEEKLLMEPREGGLIPIPQVNPTAYGESDSDDDDETQMEDGQTQLTGFLRSGVDEEDESSFEEGGENRKSKRPKRPKNKGIGSNIFNHADGNADDDW